MLIGGGVRVIISLFELYHQLRFLRRVLVLRWIPGDAIGVEETFALAEEKLAGIVCCRGKDDGLAAVAFRFERELRGSITQQLRVAELHLLVQLELESLTIHSYRPDLVVIHDVLDLVLAWYFLPLEHVVDFRREDEYADPIGVLRGLVDEFGGEDDLSSFEMVVDPRLGTSLVGGDESAFLHLAAGFLLRLESIFLHHTARPLAVHLFLHNKDKLEPVVVPGANVVSALADLGIQKTPSVLCHDGVIECALVMSNPEPHPRLFLEFR